jgi:cytochrome c
MLAVAASALAGDATSPARGKELFTGKQLGTNGKSCSTCHPGGKGLEKAAAYDNEELGTVINQCITKPLKGTSLAPSSSEMKSMILYIRSLAPAAGN